MVDQYQRQMACLVTTVHTVRGRLLVVVPPSWHSTGSASGRRMTETHAEATGQADLALLLALKIGFGVGTPSDVEQLRGLRPALESVAG